MQKVPKISRKDDYVKKCLCIKFGKTFLIAEEKSFKKKKRGLPPVWREAEIVRKKALRYPSLQADRLCSSRRR